ncbi:34103_t:CDS:2, partial [Gigaspora margarita]
RSKKNFILDIIDELKKELQFKYNEIESTSWPTVSAVEHSSSFSISNGREVDIHIEINGPSVIQTFDGILIQQKNGTIDIVVTPDEGKFSLNCRKRSKTSIHHIILTKKSYICRDLKI